MIEKDYTFGNVFIFCDNYKCKSEFNFEALIDNYPDVQEACKYAKEYGWIIFKEDNYYWHYCCEECKLEDEK